MAVLSSMNFMEDEEMKCKMLRRGGLFLGTTLIFMCIIPVLSWAQTGQVLQEGTGAVVVGAEGVDAILNGAVSGDGLPLKTAIQSAMDTNPEFLSQKFAYSASHDMYLRSFGALLPKLDLLANAGYITRRNDTTIAMYSNEEGDAWANEEKLVLSQLLFDGGLTSSKVEADKLYSQSKKEELFNTAEDVGLKSTQYFMEVIRNRALVDLCKLNIAEHEKLVDLTRIRLNNGGGTQVDVTQAEASLDEARSRLIQATQGLEDAEAGYSKFFGVKPGKLAMPDRPIQAIPQNQENAITLALDNNRALKAARLAILQQEKKVDSAKGNYMPELKAKVLAGRSDNTGGYTQSYHDLSGMLELNFNLYNGGSDAAAIRVAKNEKLKAEQEAYDVERTVAEDVKTAYSFFKVTGNLLPVLRDLANENAMVVASYTDQFRMGKRTLLDLVSAQKSLFSSQQVYLNGMTAHTFSYYRIFMPISSLMSTLGVDLKIAKLGKEK